MEIRYGIRDSIELLLSIIPEKWIKDILQVKHVHLSSLYLPVPGDMQQNLLQGTTDRIYQENREM
jgi:hypothetical protein